MQRKKFENIQKDTRRRKYLLNKKWNDKDHEPGCGLTAREERELEDLQVRVGEFLEVVDFESFVFHKDLRDKYVRSKVLYDVSSDRYYEMSKDIDGNISFSVSDGFVARDIKPTYADLFKYVDLMFEKLPNGGLDIL